jgi:hypothetical protein
VTTFKKYLENFRSTHKNFGTANAQRSAKRIIRKFNSSFKDGTKAEFERIIDEKHEGGTKWAFSMFINVNDRRAYEVVDILNNMANVVEANIEDGNKGKIRIIVRISYPKLKMKKCCKFKN